MSSPVAIPSSSLSGDVEVNMGKLWSSWEDHFLVISSTALLLYENETEYFNDPKATLINIPLVMIEAVLTRLEDKEMESGPGGFVVVLKHEELSSWFSSSSSTTIYEFKSKKKTDDHARTWRGAILSAIQLASVNSSTSFENSRSLSDSELEVIRGPFICPAVISVNQLVFIRLLGRGMTGNVYLCRVGDTRVAVKAMAKAELIRLGTVAAVKRERFYMSSLIHPFIIRAPRIYAFSSDTRLYLISEPCEYGDLYDQIKLDAPFNDDSIRFYAAQVVLVLEYIHRRGLMLRDLRPENILLDDQGYIRLCDFMYVKNVNEQEPPKDILIKTRSRSRSLGDEGDNAINLAGSLEYMPPERVEGRGEGFVSDWWQLGVLCYEMATGKTPFRDEDSMAILRKITLGKYSISMNEKQSIECASFVEHLLRVDPQFRLGYRGVNEIKSHPFFRNFDWNSLLKLKYENILRHPVLVPPNRKRCDANLLTRNFEAEAKEAKEKGKSTAPWTEDPISCEMSLLLGGNDGLKYFDFLFEDW